MTATTTRESRRVSIPEGQSGAVKVEHFTVQADSFEIGRAHV